MTQNVDSCQVPKTGLPIAWGLNPVKRLSVLYKKLLWQKMGTEPSINNWGIMGKTFKTMLTSMDELQIAALLLAHFSYSPTKNGDAWLEKTLKSRMYPFELFIKNINVYKTYLIYDRQIEYDDVDGLRNVIYSYIDRLTN